MALVKYRVNGEWVNGGVGSVNGKEPDAFGNVEIDSLPTASASVLGGIKVGTNLSISDGVLSATDTDTTYSAGTGMSLSGTTFSTNPSYTVTSSHNGYMTVEDKAKLDSINIGYGDVLPSDGNEGDIFLLGLGGTTGYLPLTGGTVDGDVNIVGTLNVTDGGYQINGATSLANLTYTVVSTW